MRKASEPKKRVPLTEEATATFRVPRDLLFEFQEIARSHERTFSQELRHLMAEHIAREKEPNGVAA